MTHVDDDARALITTGGLHRTLFVEAGAGTGKTRELVHRIVNLVLDEGVPLAGIAAITFTEAAASELADRIREAFERRAAVATDPVLVERCRAAIADTDRAAICTLHSFASRILSEHPLPAGLPPRVGILDEVSSTLAQEARWERFLDALYDDPVNHELLERALLTNVRLERRYTGQATLKDVAVVLAQSWDRLEEVVARDPGPLPPVDFGAFDRAAAEVRALPARCADKNDALRKHLDATVIPALNRLASLTDPDRRLRALRSIEWKSGSGGKPANWGDPKAVRDTIRNLNTATEDVLGTAANHVLERLLVLVSREVVEAAEARRREGTLEFHDLLVLARRLLRTDEPTRRALHDRYTHLLLDEFQDTDPIQIELAVLIAAAVGGIPAPAKGSAPLHWEDVEVPEGRLFFVGDAKQSIYRFRRADIGLFLAARDRFSSGGEPVRLRTNFRTVEPVLAWVNSLFGRLMDHEEPGAQPAYEPLVADRRKMSRGADHRPMLLGGPHEKATAGQLREHEAVDVAGVIEAIRHEPGAWPVWDRHTGRWRDARLTDVTILLPTRTSLPALRTALAAADIPYRLNTGTLVYDSQEVRDALAVVRCVDDPTDELSLVAALRSPLYACRDTDLFEHVQAGGRWDLRRDPAPALGTDHPVSAALAHLRSLWRQRWWMGPSALLNQILGDRGAFLLAFGEGRPKEVWRRLRFLVDQARAFEEAGGGGLSAFVDWAELQRAEGSRVHEPLLPELDEDSVQIMTIHGSKGLEFPITIVSGMTTRPSNRRGGVSVLWDDDGPQVKVGKGVATPTHDARADIELEMDRYEKLRLLYVATTRARDHLVVACHHKVTEESYGRMVWDLCAGEESLWRRPRATQPLLPLVVPPTPLGDLTGPEEDRAGWLAARQALLDGQRTSRVVSATAIATAAAVPLEPEGADPDEPLEPQPGVLTPRRRGRAGTALGRAVHATLQFTDLAAPDTNPWLDLEAQHQAELEAVPELAATVVALARSALASEAVALAAKWPHHQECFVAAPVGDRVIEGYVDLLVDTPEGLVVVDYKTDTVGSPAEIDAKLAGYALQGAAYAVALEAATGMPVVDVRFVFCRPEGAVERRVADLEAVKDAVRAHLER